MSTQANDNSKQLPCPVCDAVPEDRPSAARSVRIGLLDAEAKLQPLPPYATLDDAYSDLRSAFLTLACAARVAAGYCHDCAWEAAVKSVPAPPKSPAGESSGDMT